MNIKKKNSHTTCWNKVKIKLISFAIAANLRGNKSAACSALGKHCLKYCLKPVLNGTLSLFTKIEIFLYNELIHSCWEHRRHQHYWTVSGRKQTLRSVILKLHCQTETRMSRNKQEIHGPDSFFSTLFSEKIFCWRIILLLYFIL